MENTLNYFTIAGGTLIKYIGHDKIVTIPDNVIEIAQNAFSNNLVIETVIFSSNTILVGEKAFENCVNLVEIKNYSNVIYFKKECFRNSGLKTITIYDNVKEIGECAFAYMNNLEKVIYACDNNLKLDHTFSHSPKLIEVEMDKKYFFPSLARKNFVKNNPNDKRPTYADAFSWTPYFDLIKKQLFESYKNGICPDCGGKIKKGLFHAKCLNCQIDFAQ